MYDSDVGITFLANYNYRKLPIYGTDENIKGLCFGKRKCCKNTHILWWNNSDLYKFHKA